MTAKTPGRTLVLTWGQTGTCREVARRLAGDRGSLVELTGPQYPFPWGFARFFGALPESVLGRQQDWPETEIPDGPWDLVVLVWPVWFLSPPAPVRSWLESAVSKGINGVHAGTPVISVITCRTMWQVASIEVSRLVRLAGLRFVGNLVLCDPTPRLVSLLTAPLLFVWGRKVSWPGVAPGQALDSPEMPRVARLAEWINEPSAGKNPLAVDRSFDIAPTLRPTVDEANLLPEMAVKWVFGGLARAARSISCENPVARWLVAVVLCGIIAMIAPPAHVLGRLVHRVARVIWPRGVERVEQLVLEMDEWPSAENRQ